MDNAIDRSYALLAVVLASFLTPYMGSSVSIALPSIAVEFSIDAVLLSWVVTGYLLATTMFLVPLGRIADIYGRKKVFSLGIVIVTFSSILSAFSTSALVLIFFRVIQGIGNAMIFATGMAILTSVFPFSERGRVLGINVTFVYLGLSLGPFLGGFLTQHLGWRSIFLANVPLGLIIIILVFFKLKGEWIEAEGESFDLLGSAIYSLTLLAIMYGFSLLPSVLGWRLIAIGVLGVFLFIQWEMNSESPIFDIDLFRKNRVFALSNLAALLNYAATFAIIFLLSLYLQYVKGLGPQIAGLILVSHPIILTIFSPLSGWLSDKVEPRIVASIGMTLTALGLSFFSFIEEKIALAYIVGSLVVLGFGLALFLSPNNNAIMSSVERRFYGVASGTLGTMRLIGMMFSMGIAMLIFALFMGRVEITPEHYGVFLKSVKTTFVVFAFLSFGGIFASLARGKLR